MVACTIAVNVVLYDLPVVKSWTRIEVSDAGHQGRIKVQITSHGGTSVSIHERVGCRVVDARHFDRGQRFLLDQVVLHPSGRVLSENAFRIYAHIVYGLGLHGSKKQG